MAIEMEFYGNKSASKKNQRLLPQKRGHIKMKIFKIMVESAVELMGAKKREKVKCNDFKFHHPTPSCN
ncbi:hypothetical protein C2S52_017210 [Perilla frutescens var. hirtella]|nr:hypothetical protein C2S52_017210 [Perilla frutescens var. hirtella]KAH6811009.1 hypothetical protein C2S51_024771 [Perilla frutescens var. frutescens]